MGPTYNGVTDADLYDELEASSPLESPLNVPISPMFGLPRREEEKTPWSVWVAFAIVAVAWGSSYTLNSLSLRHFEPLTFVALRHLIGASVLTLLSLGQLLLFKHRKIDLLELISWQSVGYMAVNALLLNTLAVNLMACGQVVVPSGITSLVLSLEAIIAVPLASCCPGSDRLSIPAMTGILIALGGVTLASFSQTRDPDIDVKAYLYSSVLLIASAACYGIGNLVLQTQASNDFSPPLLRVTGMMLFSLLFQLPLAFFSAELQLFQHGALFGKDLSYLWHTPMEAWIYLFMLALGPGMVCHYLYYYCVQYIGSKITLTAFVIPLTGLAFGVLVNNDWSALPRWAMACEALGCGFLLLGLWLVLKKKTTDSNAYSSNDIHEIKSLLAGPKQCGCSFPCQCHLSSTYGSIQWD